MGVAWTVVPKTGHMMGVQNPEGLAETRSEAMATSWPR